MRFKLNDLFEDRESILLFGIVTLISTSLIISSNLRYFVYDLVYFPFITGSKMAHFYFNYFDLGFIKRGLVGTVLKMAAGDFGTSTIRITSFFIVFALSLVLAYQITAARRYFDKPSYYLMAALVVFSPAVFLNLGFDLGRYDHFLIIGSIISFYAIAKGKFLLLLGTTITGILIHEIYFLFFLPVIAYTAFFHSDYALREKVTLLLVSGILLGIILLFGGIEGLSREEVADLLGNNSIHQRKIAIIWTRNVWNNIDYTSWVLANFDRNIIMRFYYGAFYALSMVALLTFLSVKKQLDYLGYLVILLASLPVYFFAIDYSRWYALTVINALIYFFYLLKKNNVDSIRITSSYVPAIIAALFGLIAGPIGKIHSFPLYRDLFENMLKFFNL